MVRERLAQEEVREKVFWGNRVQAKGAAKKTVKEKIIKIIRFK